MEIQEVLREPSHVDRLRGVDAHPLQGRTMSHRRNYQAAIVLEANESAIEEMIDAGRQKQTILPIQAIFVGRIPPWLAMARDQMHGIFDTGISGPEVVPIRWTGIRVS